MTINKIKQIFFTPSRIDTSNKSKARPSIQSVYRTHTHASPNNIYRLCPKAKYKSHTRHLTASKNMQLVGLFSFFQPFWRFGREELVAICRTSFLDIFFFGSDGWKSGVKNALRIWAINIIFFWYFHFAFICCYFHW